MFTVIYKFSVKAGMEDQFIAAWAEMTDLIKTYEGGLGSRLHLEKSGEYIAYAQWPNREQWEKAGDRLPESAETVRKAMRDSCDEMETIHEMKVVVDLLIH